ncbi:MAG TPA: protein-disulfide reductase DsbD domain-containing protein [Vicinamibacterales bacterium]|nr:protein-disulfide reductase DsbD domain-containing protein [Vicinamibacterales bacterium]
MRFALAFLTASAMASGMAVAQTAPSLQFKGGSAHATIQPSPAAVDAAPGAKAALTLDVTPKAGIHVYAPGTKDFIPIELKLDANPAVKAGKTAYPKSELMTFGDEKVPVFEKPFKLTNEVTIAKGTKAGAVTVSGTVHLQACDDKVCYPPENVPVSWTVNVK